MDAQLVRFSKFIASGAMHRDGNRFFRSDNGVWLVDAALIAYLITYSNPT